MGYAHGIKKAIPMYEEQKNPPFGTMKAGFPTVTKTKGESLNADNKR